MHRAAAILASLILCAGTALASLPFTYQGELLENGVPANGVYPMTFQLTDSQFGGLLLQSVSIPAVTVTNGRFTVELAFQDSHFDSGERYVSVVVNGTTLNPRQRLTYTPRANFADRAREAGTVRVPLVLEGETVVMEAYAAAAAGTGVRGVHLAGTGTAPGVLGQSNSESSGASGLRGEIVSTTPGSQSAGVRGVNNGTGTLGIGVFGSHAGSGWGVHGTAPSGRGVNGTSTNGVGVRGQSTSGIGVEASTTTGVALSASQGASGTMAELGNDQYGVQAWNVDVEGEGTGLFSTGGRVGIEGYATGAGFGLDLTRIGVRGKAGDFNSGAMHLYGVYGFGQAPAGGGGRFAYGVYGIAQSGTSASTGYGVFGEVVGPGQNFAGYFQGNVHVAGTLTKSNGAFRIDHPQDPENRTLTHSFVESPDMLNIYSGVAELDASGRVRISLPGYFEALNTSFRYQLTALGAAMPDLHIAAEVSGNVFEVAGGKPGAKVSWQVTGVRHDAAARALPIIVEEDKPPHQRGKYLNPAAFGAGPDRAIHHAPAPAS